MKYPIAMLIKPYLEAYDCTSIQLFPGDIEVASTGLSNIAAISLSKSSVEFFEKVPDDFLYHSRLYREAEASWLIALIFNIKEVDY